MIRVFLILSFFSGNVFAVDAQTTSSLPANQEHIQYWMKTLETSPLIIVRKQAARHLGALQSTTATPSLIKGLSDVNDDVRIQSAYSLGRLGDTSSLKPLYELIEKTSNSQVKASARNAIDKINAHEDFMKQRKQKFKEQQEKAAANSSN
ncbi:MAG: HEAT repeat domain-containing protein [Proteobacteria bacterium]|jgi:HEAT repeat protein|nr:HEAT repeat domain-containing protein [Pseudomonadota bacterium]